MSEEPKYYVTYHTLDLLEVTKLWGNVRPPLRIERQYRTQVLLPAAEEIGLDIKEVMTFTRRRVYEYGDKFSPCPDTIHLHYYELESQ